MRAIIDRFMIKLSYTSLDRIRQTKYIFNFVEVIYSYSNVTSTKKIKLIPTFTLIIIFFMFANNFGF